MREAFEGVVRGRERSIVSSRGIRNPGGGWRNVGPIPGSCGPGG